MAPRIPIIILTIAAVTCEASPALAQARATTADLSGIVFDQSKAVVPGATISAINTATSIDRSAVSGRDGRYSIPALPPGPYTVRARRAGFTHEMENVVLALGQAAELDLLLTVGATSESVTVTGTFTSLDAHRTAVATVVSQRQIGSLPVNGRNFISFSTIVPGVSSDRTPQQGASATSRLTFAGQRARSNNIMVDGLDNNDLVTGAVRAMFGQEAVLAGDDRGHRWITRVQLARRQQQRGPARRAVVEPSRGQEDLGSRIVRRLLRQSPDARMASRSASRTTATWRAPRNDRPESSSPPVGRSTRSPRAADRALPVRGVNLDGKHRHEQRDQPHRRERRRLRQKQADRPEHRGDSVVTAVMARITPL